MNLPKLPVGWSGRIKLALRAIAVLLLLWLISAVVYRLFILPRQAAQEKAAAVVQEETATATTQAAQGALQTVTEVRREIVRIDAQTRRNDHAIKSAAGAETRVPGVAAALHDSLCRRAAYHREPDCAAVRGDGGGLGAAGPHPGRGTAGE